MKPFIVYLIGTTTWTALIVWRGLVTPELILPLTLLYIGGTTIMSVSYVTFINKQSSGRRDE